MMTKSFKQLYSDVENWNNIKAPEYGWEVDYHQLDPMNMDTFLNLEDTFIESKKNYGGKMWSNVIVWRKEKHLEVKWFNYMSVNVEPNRADDKANIAWFSYDNNGDQKARYFEFVEDGNLRKIKILQDGMYRLMHKEEYTLYSADREVLSYYNLVRNWNNTPLCVYHIQWNLSKTFSVSWWWSVTVRITLWEMHPRITAYCDLYAQLKKWDILEFKMLGNKTDLNEANRVDISAQTRPTSNVWLIEYVNYAFDDLNKWIKKHYPLPGPTP